MFSVLVVKGKKEKAKTAVIITSEAIIRIKNRFPIKKTPSKHYIVFRDFWSL
jgi:hypothetical protein